MSLFDDVAANNNELLENVVLPFIIDAPAIHGRFVRLGSEINKILTGHDYPESASRVLGELLVLTVMLGSTLKLDGMLSIQVQSDGPIGFLLADYTSEGHIRGYLKIQDEKAVKSFDFKKYAQSYVSKLLGSGHLVISMEHGPQKERYQGLSALDKPTLSENFTQYFEQSEQLLASIRVAIDRRQTPEGKSCWYAGGIMLKRLPDEASKLRIVVEDEAPYEDMWEREVVFLQSTKDEELVNVAIPPNKLLFNLFHEDGVRVLVPKRLVAQCRCSREKMQQVLTQLTDEEIASLKVESDKISMTCEFCSRTEEFTDEDLTRLS